MKRYVIVKYSFLERYKGFPFRVFISSFTKQIPRFWWDTFMMQWKMLLLRRLKVHLQVNLQWFVEPTVIWFVASFICSFNTDFCGIFLIVFVLFWYSFFSYSSSDRRFWYAYNIYLATSNCTANDGATCKRLYVHERNNSEFPSGTVVDFMKVNRRQWIQRVYHPTLSVNAPFRRLEW